MLVLLVFIELLSVTGALHLKNYNKELGTSNELIVQHQQQHQLENKRCLGSPYLLTTLHGNSPKYNQKPYLNQAYMYTRDGCELGKVFTKSIQSKLHEPRGLSYDKNTGRLYIVNAYKKDSWVGVTNALDRFPLIYSESEDDDDKDDDDDDDEDDDSSEGNVLAIDPSAHNRHQLHSAVPYFEPYLQRLKGTGGTKIKPLYHSLEIFVPPSTEGLKHPYGIYTSHTRGIMFVTNQDTNNILWFDLASGKPLPTSEGMKIKQQVQGEAGEQHQLYAAGTFYQGNDSKSKYRFRDIVMDEDRGLVFASKKRSGVLVFDMNGFINYVIQKNIGQAIGLAYSPIRSSLFVGDVLSKDIKEYSVPDWRLLNTIELSKHGINHPAGIAIEDDGKVLYVSCQIERKLARVEVDSGKVDIISTGLLDEIENLILVDI